MVANGVRAAPLWETKKQSFVGMYIILRDSKKKVLIYVVRGDFVGRRRKERGIIATEIPIGYFHLIRLQSRYPYR